MLRCASAAREGWSAMRVIASQYDSCPLFAFDTPPHFKLIASCISTIQYNGIHNHTAHTRRTDRIRQSELPLLCPRQHIPA